ncbi:protection of telomeres protein 1a-like [Chenopodium quinoa]|uniref:protection of telomeres protein 1a-like n=1 Tax=Chenopodium quinoa TaxID=63459 RepID=UPI000B76F471|nr:protection of telomeres protein 1a-like [Chenopodium quinoa]XP_021726928.1 protection of telomeres protein 1a-like [Chenopodium quinoa]XP_021726929.1 protection of telomeres protein 1a-like [Chenopodium quinoa]
MRMRLHTEKENPLPLQLEPQPLARETLCKFLTLGTILRVSVDKKNVKLNISSVSAGRWIKFINLMFKVHEGLWCGVLTSSTKVRFLPNEHLDILERQRLVIHMLSFFWCMVHFDLVNIMYLRFVAVSLSNLHHCMFCVKRLYICFIRDFEKRLSSKLDRMPFTSFPWPCRITEIDDKVEDVPLVTLTDVMTYPQVTGNYKCIVRVVAALPWTIQDFRSPDGTYRIRLTLEDPTGRIHAYLYAEDGEVFFEGNPPMDALIRKWNTLLGVAEVDSGGVIENAPRNPPWVLCCIKSYYFDKNDVWGSRKWTWSTRNFSYAGRVKLIETVFLSLHIYWAQIMVLPKKVLKDVEQACINFLWHGSDLKQSPNLVAWKEVCKSKKEGGLNIRDIHSWNIAAMGKHVWAISTICG